jgi:hypothetical protein
MLQPHYQQDFAAGFILRIKMNKRIRELANQARCTVNQRIGFNDVQRQAYFDEKFAELIVKKFDDILLLQQLDCIGNNDKKSAELIEKIRLNTKTYFGVEE